MEKYVVLEPSWFCNSIEIIFNHENDKIKQIFQDEEEIALEIFNCLNFGIINNNYFPGINNKITLGTDTEPMSFFGKRNVLKCGRRIRITGICSMYFENFVFPRLQFEFIRYARNVQNLLVQRSMCSWCEESLGIYFFRWEDYGQNSFDLWITYEPDNHSIAYAKLFTLMILLTDMLKKYQETVKDFKISQIVLSFEFNGKRTISNVPQYDFDRLRIYDSYDCYLIYGTKDDKIIKDLLNKNICTEMKKTLQITYIKNEYYI